MTYIGVTPQGKSILLSPPVSVRLNRGEDAPADGFTGIFPLEKSVGNITSIKIYDKKQQLCFDGIVDEQKEGCAAERTLTLVARSRAALLLDNEAMPQTYHMPSLQTIFTRHCPAVRFSKRCRGRQSVQRGTDGYQGHERMAGGCAILHSIFKSKAARGGNDV